MFWTKQMFLALKEAQESSYWNDHLFMHLRIN